MKLNGAGGGISAIVGWYGTQNTEVVPTFPSCKYRQAFEYDSIPVTLHGNGDDSNYLETVTLMS